MSHIEKRANLYYATLTVPADVRGIIGKAKFVQSTQTPKRAEALLRAALLVAGWKSEIAKARGKLPDAKATFWDTLRHDYINAADEGTKAAIEDVAEAAARKVSNLEEASALYKFATDQAGTLLAPLVEDWKGSLRLAQKTIDQQHRDVLKMADQFGSVEALKPQKVKAWTDKLIKDGATAATLERVMNGCRSLWRYLQDSGTIPVEAPDPFLGVTSGSKVIQAAV